jgi:murein DD-endopeptidase MepM/ murein hydrolase activator NlpD
VDRAGRSASARDEDVRFLSHLPAQHFPRARTGHRHRLLLALFAVPFMLSVIGAPAIAPGPVNGDELSDAQAQQKALAQRIADQKALVAQISRSQDVLAGKIDDTKDQLAGITHDLAATRRRVDALAKDIDDVRATYDGLVRNLGDLDLQLQRIELQESQKKEELRQRKAELADRIREAYEAERTSMLETFLSGATFTDMLAQMSSQLDVAEQDRALAQQIALDRETLLSLHRTVEDTRAATDLIRQQTAVQKQKLDRRMGELREAQAKLKRLEKAAQRALDREKAQYAKLAADKEKLRKAMAATAAARRQLQHKIDRLIARQFNHGNIPSQYNGTLKWPMPGVVTQDFGCTGFAWEPPFGDCAHFHNGIDMVAPYGTPVRASGAGRVVYIGWNYADGADPAFIVVIAHSAGLSTWYAHLQSRYPVRAGQLVKQGQVIGYEGNTGHSTGAHLHWMVEFDGSFANPRLFT